MWYSNGERPAEKKNFVRALYGMNVVVYGGGLLSCILAGVNIGTRTQWAMLLAYSSGSTSLVLAVFFFYYGIR